MRSKFRSKKHYPIRNFFNSEGNKVAYYIINPIGDESSVIIHSDYLKKPFIIPKSYLEDPTFAVIFLSEFMPRKLARAIIKHAVRDLKVETKSFSLKSYIKWKPIFEELSRGKE
ncbi:MAG: hypothetical protein QXT67_04915 [Candidatus Bathyarchaeia archaeon]